MVRLCVNPLLFPFFAEGCVQHTVAPQKGDSPWLKRRFRAIFGTLPPNCGRGFGPRSKNADFRSEQAFLIAACEQQLRQGDNTEATAQLESRIAATLANMAKEVQSLFTLVQTQVALTNSLLQYVLTCVVEPPEEVLPAARARVRLRYAKILGLPSAIWPMISARSFSALCVKRRR